MITLTSLFRLALESLLLAAFGLVPLCNLVTFLSENGCMHVLPICLPQMTALKLVVQALKFLPAKFA